MTYPSYTGAARHRYASAPKTAETNPNYWDCECAENYIRERGKVHYCLNCNCHAEDRPDSRQPEVMKLLFMRGRERAQKEMKEKVERVNAKKASFHFKGDVHLTSTGKAVLGRQTPKAAKGEVAECYKILL